MNTVLLDASQSAARGRGTRRSADWSRLGRPPIPRDVFCVPPCDDVAREGRVVFKPATSREEYHAAYRLVYSAYLRAGLAVANPFEMRVTPYHLLPTTETFVAVRDDVVISTMSLIRDAQLGLPMESVYGPEVEQFREYGYTLAEVSCLADQPQGRARSVSIVLRLMSLMAQCARRRGVDQLLIAVHPRHVPFYERFTAFEVIGKQRPYHTVCDHPAVAMGLDLHWAQIHHPKLYARFFGTPYPESHLRHRPMSGHLRAELRWVAQANRVATPSTDRELPAAG